MKAKPRSDHKRNIEAEEEQQHAQEQAEPDGVEKPPPHCAAHTAAGTWQHLAAALPLQVPGSDMRIWAGQNGCTAAVLGRVVERFVKKVTTG